MIMKINFVYKPSSKIISLYMTTVPKRISKLIIYVMLKVCIILPNIKASDYQNNFNE